jgi:hydroxybutyrate-dimer hydrolase
MVQVPASFDRAKACIITATSSGSRGVFGAISTGEWGLKRGCAVAYTDKGTGAAAMTCQRHRAADRRHAQRLGRGRPGRAFALPLTAAELAAFNAATPNRWPSSTRTRAATPRRTGARSRCRPSSSPLRAQRAPRRGRGQWPKLRTFRPNTLVIASSASNGGGAAIAAAEQDSKGLIDGVAVSEPAIEMPRNANVVQRGSTVQPTIARTLLDFTPMPTSTRCAALAPELAGTFQSTYALPAVYGTLATNRCAALRPRAC